MILVMVTLVMIPNVALSIDDPGFGDSQWLIDDPGLVILERCQSIDDPG